MNHRRRITELVVAATVFWLCAVAIALLRDANGCIVVPGCSEVSEARSAYWTSVVCLTGGVLSIVQAVVCGGWRRTLGVLQLVSYSVMLIPALLP